jgi:hypothetical protein
VLDKLGSVGGTMPNACYDVLDQIVPVTHGTFVRDDGAIRTVGSNLRYCDTPARVVVAEITGASPRCACTDRELLLQVCRLSTARAAPRRPR